MSRGYPRQGYGYTARRSQRRLSRPTVTGIAAPSRFIQAADPRLYEPQRVMLAVVRTRKRRLRPPGDRAVVELSLALVRVRERVSGRDQGPGEFLEYLW